MIERFWTKKYFWLVLINTLKYEIKEQIKDLNHDFLAFGSPNCYAVHQNK